MTTPEHGLTPTADAAGTVTQVDIDLAVETLRDLAGWHIWPVREETVTVDTPGAGGADIFSAGSSRNMLSIISSNTGSVTMRSALAGKSSISYTRKPSTRPMPYGTATHTDIVMIISI